MVQPRQDELAFAADTEPAATASIEEVERVVSILREHGQQTAREIAVKMGWVGTENDKRKVRAIAHAARPGIISFPGSAGYKLLKDCSIEEINAAISTWSAVKKDAEATLILLERAYHSRAPVTR